MRAALALLVALVCLVALPTAASADDPLPLCPATLSDKDTTPCLIKPNIVGVIQDPVVLSVMAVADDQWRDLGHEPGCQPKETFLFDNAGIFGVADDKTCRLGIGTELMSLLASARLSSDPWLLRTAYNDLCHIAVHEKGHLFGLPDMDPTGGGIMAWSTLYSTSLPRCDAWAAARTAEWLPPKPKTKCRTRRCKARRYIRAVCRKADHNPLTTGPRLPKMCQVSREVWD